MPLCFVKKGKKKPTTTMDEKGKKLMKTENHCL
jgi:hypothetical protein